ncbi:Conserved_hypothetical protein [Hexamita inflata]|uniref:Uncharacterized protein n=1 Tax=Hexamita inflata TaxID=28002 RepID=A0AA86RMA5_9EUKA|nr:Conserved hypothetical protein [Hexamita inflata]
MRGVVIPGHRVASGLNNNPKYPGGTLRMQLQFFKELGLDLSQYYLGTLNIQTSSTLKLIKPFKTFENVKWCEDPAETFSFIQILLECTVMGGGIAFSCLLCEQLYIKIFCHFQCG